MDLVLQTNIFFYITSAAVVVVTVLVCIVLYYLVRILRDVRDMTDRMRRGSEALASDLESLRVSVKEEGMRLRDLAAFFLRRAGIGGQARAARPRKARAAREEESA